MRKLLLFFAMLCVSIGTWAATISGDGISGATDNSSGKKVQTLVVETPGALAAWVAAHTGNYDTNNPFQGLGGSDDFYSLKISGTLSAEDFAALNSTTCAAFSRFPRIDMSEVTLASGATKADVFAVNFGTGSFDKNGTTISGDGATYIRLPNDMTSEEDVTAMAKMKQSGKNANLKMVGAYDPDNSELDDSSKKWAEVAMHSFEANNVATFLSEMGMPTSGNPTIVPRDIKMSGEYGDQDLVGSGGPNFGHGTSAKWDFTGAHFADCTVADATQNATYYNYDDPFCEGELVACPTTTNAFYYFSQYDKNAVDLKLPDVNMTHLPFRCISDLASDNVSGYKALYGETEFNNNKVEDKVVPIESLVIPDSYTDLDEECGKWARIRHLVVGSGMKHIHGGAFLKCDYLEDLDFAAGLENCYIGDRSFNECRSMKHIALSEGIVSLGNGCFWNSQHLESIRLPQTLINMGNHCFDNCLALNSITIPENVKKIGQCAFRLCPFTDIYLTTTDPANIPYIWTAGTSFSPKDMNSTFYSPDFDGNNGIPNQASEIPSMSWDEAVQWYYVRANGIPVLHYPKELADKVRAEISSTYGGRTNDDPAYGLPLQGDREKRANIPGADLGSAGTGKFSQDGWAQLMLMKEFTTDPGGDVYSKKYEDVWYTMCFPFDLTDEQLAAAFNETFNIVDFSGVEVKEADEEAGTPKKLVLHFNKVAKTYYRDIEGNEYEVIGREVDPESKFSYNIYRRDGVVYHHSKVSSLLASNKTKTFAPGNSIAESNANKDNAIMIDGVLATAGHPYMIHPAIGTSIGNPKRCDFSGIEWKPMTQWATIFDAQKRVVDLGEARGTIDEDDFKRSVPDADNYTQAAYSKYAGQTYTFIGNATEYRADAQEAIGNEPQVPEEPIEPVAPTRPADTLLEPETVSEPTPLTADEQYLFSRMTDGEGQYNPGIWNGEDEITAEYNDGSEQYNKYANGRTDMFFPKLQELGYNPYGSDDEKAAAFNYSKSVFNKAKGYSTAYAAYEANQAEWAAYNANQAAWARYNAWQADNGESEWAVYRPLKQAYDEAVAAHDTWVENAKKWMTYIPKGSYFLGRRGTALPKYYRETADDPAEGQASTRTGGVWTQFTAIVIPNDAALNGVEKELDGRTAQSKGFDMAFDEGFLGEVISQDEATTLIEKAQAEGAEVEYMDIVVSINGQVVRRGTTSIEGLPKGIYIINGKKYFVK